MSQQSEITIRYFPHPNQERFHRDRYKVRFRLVSAGTGGGKTFAGVDEDFGWSLDNPGCVGIIFEPTYKMIKRILIRQTLEDPHFLGRPLEASPLITEYHKTENRLELVNGSTIWFVGLDEPEAAEGSSIDYAHVDEARLIPKFEEAWESILRRLRGSGRGDFPIGAWVTTTPTQPGTYLHKFFEDPKTKDPQAQVYRWSLLDNIYVPEEYKQSLVRTHTGGLEEVFIYGRFAALGIGAFPFDYTRHVIGEKNCPYKIMPETFKEIVYGVDFGWTNPAAIVAIGLDGDGRAFCLDEFYQNRVQLETLIEEAESMRGEYGDGRFICDKSEPMNIDKINRAGLRAEANKLKREEGIMDLGGRFNDAGDGKPRLFFHSKCVNLISELQIYNEKIKENDHAVDALRYALSVAIVGELDVGTAKIPW